jgi:hypothetical protein
MDNREMMKQMIELHRISFGNCFSAMVTLQDQAEKLMDTLVNHLPGITDDGKKVMNRLNSTYKKNRDDFKKVVDEGYARVEAFFDGNAIASFQNHAGKISDIFSGQKFWMPKDWTKTMEEFTDIYKKGYDDFNKYINDSIQSMKSLYPAADKQKKDINS